MDFNHRGIIKRILQDHFGGFWTFHANQFPTSYQQDIYDMVQKALRCGTRDMGYIRYECLGCPKESKPVFVCFSCKSRFCNKCGKKYTDDWATKQQELVFDVPHRHMVFTIPEELRNVFFEDRYKMQELSRLVADVFGYYYEQRNKKLQITPGIVTVIHTFGRDLKFNPHIHVLVTEGGMDKYHEWRPLAFISYEYLRKSWQKIVLDAMKRWFPDNLRVQRLVNQLYSRYPKGFYVNAEKKMNNAKSAAKYIGRYLARPAIAEYRIQGYDKKQVTFWYEDHRTGKKVIEKQSVYRFIFNLLQHIPPKHFRMVGRFGIYSRRKYEKASQAMRLYAFVRTKQIEMVFTRVKKKKTYRQRIMESFGQDPFWCFHCQRSMELVEIIHPDRGLVYHYMFEAKTICKT